MRLVILCQNFSASSWAAQKLRNDGKKISLSLKKDSSELAMILVYYDYNPKSSTTTQRLASGPSFGEKAKLLLLLRIGKEALELPSSPPSQLLQFLSNYWLRFASTLTIIYRSLFP